MRRRRRWSLSPTPCAVKARTAPGAGRRLRRWPIARQATARCIARAMRLRPSRRRQIRASRSSRHAPQMAGLAAVLRSKVLFSKQTKPFILLASVKDINMPAHRKPTPERYCQECGKRLERKPLPNGDLEYSIHFNRRKFCDQRCMAANFDRRHSPEVGWSTAHYHARKIVEPGPCNRCGKPNALDVQHRMDGNHLNNDPSNLERICRGCHNLAHRRKGSCLDSAWQASEGLGLLREALSAVQKARRSVGGEDQSAHDPWAVRRLTPEECEFLQAMPRGYTRIPYRGRPADLCPDGPRYKAIGNSWATNCAEWIGERIAIVDQWGDA